MTGDVVPFPVSPRLTDDRPRPWLKAGDMVVTCINDTLGLWCAWPVAIVDDDGVVIGIRDPAGRLKGADRVNCRAHVYGFVAEDHQAEPFRALRWKTWRTSGEAVEAFAEIGAGHGV